MIGYPKVHGEFETMRRIAEGYNIARFGDGEFKMACGKGYRRQLGSEKLAAELCGILNEPAANCLVGIPTMNSKGPKIQSWVRHRDRFSRLLPAHRRFHSAFISRPDSAPWISTREYAEMVQSLWTTKRVALLAEPDNSIVQLIARTASCVNHIVCPSHGSYKLIDEFEDDLVDSNPDIIVMSCGPTATCLANRFALLGFHAVDIGSAGGFLTKLLK